MASIPILRKNLGGKAIKMIYNDDPTPGKTVVTVDVDEADSHRFSLSEDEIIELAKMAVTIEEHYQRPMDIEWGKDGTDGKLYILQARPETVQSRSGRTIQRFTLKGRSEIISKGRSIGQKIGAGTARVIRDVSEMNRVQNGRRARFGHDGPRLGAGHETGGGHRHESRRPHLPRGDHRARTGHTGCRRLR